MTLHLILAALIQAASAIGLRLVTAEFFEAVLVRIIVWAGDRIVLLTPGKLDDEVWAETKKRLQKPGGGNG